MVDNVSAELPAPQPHCMWCSAVLPSDSELTCPTCGATLIGEGDNQVPGVTAIDAAAILRGVRSPKPKQRSRLMSWISGEYNDDADTAPPGSLEPPPPEVRREMLRLELQAEVANLQAEVGAMAAEAAIESGRPIELPGVNVPDQEDDSEPAADADHSEADASEAKPTP